jgi:hypothetical protein
MQNRNHDLPEPSFTKLRRRWREQIGAVLSDGEQGALPFALPSRAHWPGGLSRLSPIRMAHCRQELAGTDSEQARAAQAVAWKTRLEVLLEGESFPWT